MSKAFDVCCLLVFFCHRTFSALEIQDGYFRVTGREEIDHFVEKELTTHLGSIRSRSECVFKCINLKAFHCSCLTYAKEDLKCVLSNKIHPSVRERYYMRRPGCKEPFIFLKESNKCYHLEADLNWQLGRKTCNSLLSHPVAVNDPRSERGPSKFLSLLANGNRLDGCRKKISGKDVIVVWTAGKECAGATSALCWQPFKEVMVATPILQLSLSLTGSNKCLALEDGDKLSARNCGEKLCVLCEKDWI